MSNSKTIVIGSFPSLCLTNLNRQRQQGFLCDVELVVGNKKFPAHRNILAASSDYFATMFSTNMKEKYSGSVKLHEVTTEAVKHILDFLYTGKIELTAKNVLGVLQAASMMQIKKLLENIDEYLLDTVNPQNALEHKNIGELFSLQALISKSKECIKRNFGQVSLSKAFLDLSYFELEIYFQSNEINVEAEDVLFTALIAWTEHDLKNRREKFYDLFSLIRLQHVSMKLLSNTIRKHKLVLAETRCRGLIEDAMHFHLEPSAFEKQKKRGFEQTLFLVTQRQTVERFSLTGTTSTFTQVGRAGYSVGANSALVMHQDKVMFCGGSVNGRNISKSIVSFDGKTWTVEGKMKYPRACATAISYKGVLYIFGGKCDGGNQHLVNTESFVNGQCAFESNLNLQETLTAACAVIIQDSIFFIGGEASNQGLGQVAIPGFGQVAYQGRGRKAVRHSSRYRNTVPINNAISSVNSVHMTTNQWMKGPQLNEARSHFAATVVNQSIYVFGGVNGHHNLTSCECLASPSDQAWTMLVQSPITFPNASCGQISDNEIVLLGSNNNQLYCFDTNQKSWKTSIESCANKQGQIPLPTAKVASRILSLMVKNSSEITKVPAILKPDQYEEDQYEEDQYVEDQYEEDQYEEDQYEEDQYVEDQYEEDQYVEDQYEDDRYEVDPYEEDLYG